MLGARRILAKCRQHLHPLSLVSVWYQAEFGGDASRAGAISGRLWWAPGAHRGLVFNTEEQARVSIPMIGAGHALACMPSCSCLPQGHHQGPGARRSLATCPASAELVVMTALSSSGFVVCLFCVPSSGSNEVAGDLCTFRFWIQ
jgi:hypothetical protein